MNNRNHQPKNEKHLNQLSRPRLSSHIDLRSTLQKSRSLQGSNQQHKECTIHIWYKDDFQPKISSHQGVLNVRCLTALPIVQCQVWPTFEVGNCSAVEVWTFEKPPAAIGEPLSRLQKSFISFYQCHWNNDIKMTLSIKSSWLNQKMHFPSPIWMFFKTAESWWSEPGQNRPKPGRSSTTKKLPTKADASNATGSTLQKKASEEAPAKRLQWSWWSCQRESPKERETSLCVELHELSRSF